MWVIYVIVFFFAFLHSQTVLSKIEIDAVKKFWEIVGRGGKKEEVAE